MSGSGWIPVVSACEVDDRELCVGVARGGGGRVLPHASVAGHRALRAASRRDRAPQRGLAATRPRFLHRPAAALAALFALTALTALSARTHLHYIGSITYHVFIQRFTNQLHVS